VTFPAVDPIEFSIQGDQYTYIFSFDIPMDLTGAVSVSLRVSDVNGNSIVTPIDGVVILDIISPTMVTLQDIEVYSGHEVTLIAECWDNVGPFYVEWSLPGGSVSGESISYVTDDPGRFEVTVRVFDEAANEFTTHFNLTVLPLDHDDDGDGIPDLSEIDLGLDPNDPDDSSGDMDNDGLTNLEEFGMGTNLSNGDSDSDGMPDLWEKEHGMDPLVHSSENDIDGDGATDLQEYLDGTDPLKPPEEMGGSSLFLILIIVFVLLLVLGLSILGFFLFKKRSGES
jgi:hypothetical protein